MPSQLSFLLLVARARRSGQRHDAPLLLSAKLHGNRDDNVRLGLPVQDGHRATGVFLFQDQDLLLYASPPQHTLLARER
jgi:hypothetical protein